MKSKWRLREPYFKGANTYQIGPKDAPLEVSVDADGMFELEKPPTFPMGIFAKAANS